MLWLVAGGFAISSFFVAFLWHLHLQSMEDTIRVRHRMDEEHLCSVGLTTVIALMVEALGIVLTSIASAAILTRVLPGNVPYWLLTGVLLGAAIVGAILGAIASWVVVELIARVGIRVARWIDSHSVGGRRRTPNRPRSS